MIKNLQNILTQDAQATADPVYVVFEKQNIIVDGDYDYDKVVYICGNDREVEMSEELFLRLEEEYYQAIDYRAEKLDSNGLRIYDEMPLDPILDKDFSPTDYERLYIKQIDRFLAAFFIRQNAENFIAANAHNLNKPFIYVESAYRNYEWQDIREFLIDKAMVEGNNVSI